MPADYVAIITDGNGRWAQQRGLPVIEGHQAGADVVKERLRDAVEFGVKELTVYSFSTENWTRPKEEVDGLMAMFAERIDGETPSSRRRASGCASSGAARGSARSSPAAWTGPRRRPAANERITLFVAFNYGGRAEILDAAAAYQGGGEEEFQRHLYAPEMHDPDLLIRTSGEQRISNYLLWQCAYSEFVFRDELWPDFTPRGLRAPRSTSTRSARGASGRGSDDSRTSSRPRSSSARPRGARARSRSASPSPSHSEDEPLEPEITSGGGATGAGRGRGRAADPGDVGDHRARRGRDSLDRLRDRHRRRRRRSCSPWRWSCSRSSACASSS